jgi:hypothetical protein
VLVAPLEEELLLALDELLAAPLEDELLAVVDELLVDELVVAPEELVVLDELVVAPPFPEDELVVAPPAPEDELVVGPPEFVVTPPPFPPVPLVVEVVVSTPESQPARRAPTTLAPRTTFRTRLTMGLQGFARGSGQFR